VVPGGGGKSVVDEDKLGKSLKPYLKKNKKMKKIRGICLKEETKALSLILSMKKKEEEEEEEKKKSKGEGEEIERL
jgi:hypothetical protein